MKNILPPKSFSMISNDALLRRLSELVQQSRRIESDLVAHIGEVEHRRLFVRYASSMYVYCTEVLHLSESESYLRIAAARAARKHPMLLEMLRDGRLHLSGIERLAPHLTEANREKLLARAAGRTKRKIEELVAEIAPKPDVPSTMRKLPERLEKTKAKATPVLQLDGVATRPRSPSAVRPAVVEPLAPARYKVEFTASTELRDKLERLRVLMRSSNPEADLSVSY